MSATLRLRRRPLAEVVQQFDAFEKVQETVREDKRIVGGTSKVYRFMSERRGIFERFRLVSLICAILIIWLTVSEFLYYTSTRLDYRFTVDTEFDK